MFYAFPVILFIALKNVFGSLFVSILAIMLSHVMLLSLLYSSLMFCLSVCKSRCSVHVNYAQFFVHALCFSYVVVLFDSWQYSVVYCRCGGMCNLFYFICPSFDMKINIFEGFLGYFWCFEVGKSLFVEGPVSFAKLQSRGDRYLYGVSRYFHYYW